MTPVEPPQARQRILSPGRAPAWLRRAWLSPVTRFRPDGDRGDGGLITSTRLSLIVSPPRTVVYDLAWVQRGSAGRRRTASVPAP